MVEHQVQEIRQQVFSLERAIGGLLSSVQTLTSTWARQDQEAGEGRRRLHDKVDALVVKVTELAVRVEHMSGEIATMKPSVARVEQLGDDVEEFRPSLTAFNEQHQQSIGSRKMLALIWAGFIGLVTALTTGMVELLHWWLNLPPSHPPH